MIITCALALVGKYLTSYFTAFQERDEQDEGKRNEYYTGGIDNRSGGGSGLAVVGPPDGRRPTGNIFDSIVQRAAQTEPSSSTSSGTAGGGEFRITLYRNGFTVNDGPLRSPEDPNNVRFLRELDQGLVPDELRRASNVSADELDVHLVDKREEDYVPPAYVAFSGGSSLGSVRSDGALLFQPSSLRSVPLESAETGDSLTNVQVRTSTGQRLKIRISTSASLQQLAALVLRDLRTEQAFTLSAGFPPKEFTETEMTQTVAEAKLQNAVVTLKFA